MSPGEIAALAWPTLPGVVLAVTLCGRRCRPALGPAQFAALIGAAILGATSHHILPAVSTAIGFAVAIIGLGAIVHYEDWVAYRAHRINRWEDFEREFRTYAARQERRRHNGPSAR